LTGLGQVGQAVQRRHVSNPTSLGYDESPWIAPRTRAGRD
jgi:hypothetical protein